MPVSGSLLATSAEAQRQSSTSECSVSSSDRTVHRKSSAITRVTVRRLESQMTSDFQAILQLLQRQTTSCPPAYSTVTSSPEYQRPAIRVQPVSAIQTDLCLDPAPPRPQSPGPEKAQNKSKEPPPVLLRTETLPDGNLVGLLEGDPEQRHTQNGVDSVEQRQNHRQQPLPRLPSGRQASLPDVPSSSGMLGLHRPVSDPWLPGK